MMAVVEHGDGVTPTLGDAPVNRPVNVALLMRVALVKAKSSVDSISILPTCGRDAVVFFHPDCR
jgi:hypothetical protein